MPKRKFGEIDDEALEKKREDLKNGNTRKSDKKVDKLFTEYIDARWKDEVPNLQYWTYADELLDKILCKFWFEARQQNEDMYNVNSLKSIRYGINRNLKKKGKQNDITKSDCFIKNQEAFQDACRELKSLGYGFVKHYEEIKGADLQKIYASEHMNPDAGPRELQNKVMWDIRYFFCRRGGENLEKMTKKTFELHFDVDTKIAYVKKVQDELTKNQREGDKEIVTGFMPQLIDPTTGRPHKMCPVRSFENYLFHLHPDLDNLWQQPKRHFLAANKIVWYMKRPIGHNPIDSFMSDLSSLCDLSQRYTNHCIRVTGATNLSKKFANKQVMSVTGHKSIESLAIYQRVQADEKMLMGMWLTYFMLNTNDAIQMRAKFNKHPNEIPENAIEAPLQQQMPAIPGPSNAVVPIAQPVIPVQPTATTSAPQLTAATPPSPDFDLQAMLKEFEEDNDTNNDLILASAMMETQNVNTRAAMIKKYSPKKQAPQFTNCHIGTINIHIHKS